MSLPRFGVTHPVPVNLLMVAMLVSGLYAGLTLRKQFFPEMQPEQAMVMLPYPGATPAEIEQNLALKVEDALADLDEVDELTTTISEGGGGIVVKFRDGVSDITKATDEVERAIDALQDLPEDAERIRVTEFEPRMPAIMLSVYGDVEETILKDTIRGLRDEIKKLPGMGEVTISGVRNYEISIDVDPDALVEHGLSLPDVSDRIRQWMAEVPGGAVRGATGNINVRTMGVPEQSEAIRQIVVKATAMGQALRVGDIAVVREGFVDEQIVTRFNGKPSASITVFKVGDQDIVKMAEMVRTYVRIRRGEDVSERGVAQILGRHRLRAAELARESAVPIPHGVTIEAHSDLARFVEGRLSLLSRNALQGGVLVFATLLIFLNVRLAFWVGMGLATALAGTLLVMQIAGVTLNLLTMFGLIIVMGILVDDAIVVSENIQAHHDRGSPPLSAGIKGGEQVAWPVLATVLTSIVAFMPLTWIDGQIGDLMGALPMVVACALSMSLIESLLILPSHVGHSLMARDRRTPGAIGRALHGYENWRDSVIFDRIIPAYAKVLRVALNYRYVSICIAIAVLIVSVGMLAGKRVGYTFLPDSDTETLIIDMRMPIGTPIDKTAEVAQRIEDSANIQDEVKTVMTLLGTRSNVDTGTTDSSATHLAQFFVELKAVEDRDRTSTEVLTSIRQGVGALDDVERISYSQIGAGGSGPAISIRVAGTSEAAILSAVADIKAELGRFDGVYDIYDDNSAGQREMQVVLKPGAAALGLTVSNVARQVRAALFGAEAHVFTDRQEDIDVRVRLDEATRRNIHAMENLWVIAPDGQRIPLSEVAELRSGESYATIKRVDRRRAVTVTAETVPDLSPEAIMSEVPLDDLQAMHPTVTIERAGRQQQQADAFSSLPLGFLAAMVMIYVILAWLFSSYTQPIAVMLAIPFGIIGVIWGHILLDFELTFLSAIGFVALSGIVVNDSLILVQFYNEKRAEGMPMIEALLEAGRRRLRPIFLTTITTVLGLTPLMLEQSFQAKFLIPMAIAIAFGLMSATVLILLILPCIIVIVDDVKATGHFLWHGRSRSDEPPSAIFEVD